MSGRQPAPVERRRRRPAVPQKARTRFLDGLAEGYSVTAAAKLAAVHRNRFYELRESDEAFAGEWAAAVEAGTDVLEQVALEIATKGALEEVRDAGGNIVSTRRRQDPATVRFLLAARRPTVYSEKQRVEVDGHLAVEHTVDSQALERFSENIGRLSQRHHEDVAAGADEQPLLALPPAEGVEHGG